MCQLNKHLTFSCSAAAAAPRKLKAETDAQLATCCDTCQNQSQRSKFFLSQWTEQTRNRVCLIWFPSMSSVRQAAPATDDSSNSCSLPHKMAATVTLPARPGYIWLHLRPQGKTATVPSEHVVKCKAYWLNYTQRGQSNWEEKNWELFKLRQWKHMEGKHAKQIKGVLWNKRFSKNLLRRFKIFPFTQLAHWLQMEALMCFKNS